jgi:hypothetical protein
MHSRPPAALKKENKPVPEPPNTPNRLSSAAPIILTAVLLSGSAIIGTFAGMIASIILLVAVGHLLGGLPEFVVDFVFHGAMGLGFGIAVAFGLWVYRRLNDLKGRAKALNSFVAIGVLFGSVAGGVIGIFEIVPDYCGPDGATNVEISFRFLGTVIDRHWERRYIWAPALDWEILGTILGTGLGATAGALLALGIMSLNRQWGVETGKPPALLS